MLRIYFFTGSKGSPVSKATRLWVGTDGVSMWAGVQKGFFSSPPHPDSVWGPPNQSVKWVLMSSG
jgi:hypothetical protein